MHLIHLYTHVAYQVFIQVSFYIFNKVLIYMQYHLKQ